jgi:hypothetical protein
MPLLTLWHSNPGAIAQLSIEQIVATAGDGKLRDDSECSQEVRQFLTQVSSERLAAFATHCLSNSFPNSGFVLQDVVNELGRRLEYTVENGRYRGVSSGIGFDGIWHSPEGTSLIVEVKTTDAYRISLDTIAAYRSKLIEAGKIVGEPSVLIVVGREDTGELEAQVRGSRHAWDMRLISIDALATLVALKESTEAGVAGAKLRSILVPMEFTRLDPLVDVMFTAARDVEATAGSEKPGAEDQDSSSAEGSSGWHFTDPDVLKEKREQIVAALGQRLGKPLVKRSRALFWDASHAVRVACTVSKRYTKKGVPPYWYAYHPVWDDYLHGGEAEYVVLGCIDLDLAFALPAQVIRDNLTAFNTTKKGDGSYYWHIKILEPTPGTYALHLPRRGSHIPLAEYALPLG